MKEIMFDLVCDNGTPVPLSNTFKLNKMFIDYNIPFEHLEEIVRRIKAIDDISEKLIKDINILGTDLNPSDTYRIKQDVIVGKLSSYYEIEYDYNAASINPDNEILRKLSIIIHTAARKKYEIIFKEEYVAPNTKFGKYGTKYVLTTNKIHSKRNFDDILNWLSENIKIWQSEC